MRRYWLLLVLVLVAAVPAAVLAARQERAFNYTIEEFGEVDLNVRAKQWIITTQSLHGYGTVAGLLADGGDAAFEIDQDLRIVIEFTSAGIRGRSRGEIVVASPVDIWEHAGISGMGRGQVLCVGDDANPCDTLDVILNQSGSLRNAADGKNLGKGKWQITGTLQRTGPDSAEWTTLEGSGTLFLR